MADTQQVVPRRARAHMTLTRLRSRFRRHKHPAAPHPDSLAFVLDSIHRLDPGAPIRLPVDFRLRLANRCPNCAARLHGQCEGGRCDCPVIRCRGISWRRP